MVWVLVGALSVLTGILPYPTRKAPEVLAAGLVLLALAGAALLVPWRELPDWTHLTVPIGYILVVTLLRDAQGGGSTGLLALYFLPVIWLAFFGKRSHLATGIAMVVLALVIPIAAIGPPDYPSDSWRVAVVTTAVITVVSVCFLSMVSRERAVVADLAHQTALAEESLRLAVEARERLDSLLRTATKTAIIGADADGAVTFFSAGAERLLGRPADQVVGTMNLADFLPAEDVSGPGGGTGSQPIADMLRTAGAGGPPKESVLTYTRADGTHRRAAVTVAARREDARTLGYVVVASDVTEQEQLASQRERLLAVQREAAQILVEQNHRLRQLTQMKDDVVATVSHELRTPLTSIRGFVELLLEGKDNLDEEQAHMLHAIDRSSRQLLRVSEDLLADPGGNRGRRAQFVDTDLSALASEAVDAMASQSSGRGISLSADAPAPVVVRGDPTRLHQLLANLLSNALKFNSPGGHVLVRVRTISTFACLEVLDDGPGIPFDERPQLFERFYRLASSADQAIPGSGLGLAIAKDVVESHEGTIDIVDTEGWATTFRVLLPLPSSRELPLPSSREQNAGSGSRPAAESEDPAPAGRQPLGVGASRAGT